MMVPLSFFLVSWLLVFKRGVPSSPGKLTGMTSDTTASFTQEVRAAFGGWTEKWNAGDLEGYLAAYADSDQTRYCAGSKVIRGKENIAAHYREQGTSGHLSLVDFEAGTMGDNFNDGLVFGQFVLVLEDGTRHTGAFTVHVRKLNGLWRILSDHSAS
jgi:ketosteroid isomerase-like protein